MTLIICISFLEKAKKAQLRFGIAFILVAILVVAATKYYIFPSWTESYLYEGEKIRALFSRSQKGPDSKLANSLVIRMTGKSGHKCSWGAHARPYKNKLKHTRYSSSRIVKELEEISSWLTDEHGTAPFAGYQTKAYGQKTLTGACQQGGFISAVIYKSGYGIIRTAPYINHITDNRVILRSSWDGKVSPEQKFERELRLMQQPLALLIPFGVNGFDAEENHLAADSLVKYWQHKLPNGKTIKVYALLEMLKIYEKMENPKLKANTAEFVRMMSKENHTYKELEAVEKFQRRLTNEYYL